MARRAPVPNGAVGTARVTRKPDQSPPQVIEATSAFTISGHAARKSGAAGATSRANGGFLTFGTVDYDLGDTSWLTIQTESGTAAAGINLTQAGLYLVTLYAESGTNNPGTGAYVDFEDIEAGFDLLTMDFTQPFSPYTNRKCIGSVPVAVADATGHILRARFYGATTNVYNTLHILKVL